MSGPPQTFEGLVALVTGGASGIGATCAGLLVDRGAQVVIADRDGAAATELGIELGSGQAVGVAADVTSLDETQAMVSTAVETFGGLDIAINNAGIGAGGTARVADLDPKVWRLVNAVNLDGVFFSMRAQIPALLARGGGAIVNVSSIMGTVGNAGSAAYVAAKHGVLGLTKTAALEYAEQGIRVNAVGPGYVDTPMLSRRTADERAATAARHPVNRLATALEIAELILFLASPAASFITGSYHLADGGYTAR